MTTAVLFDLDDTLYREMDYVQSGFRAVAGFLDARYGFKSDDVYEKAMGILTGRGRGKVFDELLRALGIFDEETVRCLVYIYRTHRPDIHVYGEVMPILANLKASGVRTGLITDGMAIVQQKKVEALSIAALFDIIIYTDAIGADCWKPSQVPFKMALMMLDVQPSESVYIGDNPSKDFLAPNVMGMKSVQIIRDRSGHHTPVPKTPDYAAHTVINSLSEYFGVTCRQ